ncbi:glycosyltransferase [Blastococcus sp. SYSU DS0619]
MTVPRARRPFVVLQSFPAPRPTTNPYVVLLGRSLAALPDVELRTFSRRRALLGRIDVFHAHWPEILVDGRTGPRRAARQLFFVLLLLRLAVTRTPWVRTIHNPELPRGLSRLQEALLRLAERRTTLWIRLNTDTPLPAGAADELIPHGHYRDWFTAQPRHTPVPGRLAFAGQIRGYKGVEQLIEAFRGTAAEAPDAELVVAGRPTSDELAERIRALSDGDPRITLDLRFLPDDDLVATITGAELVVLPYPEMHNSGGVLAALSLDRPVLVPGNEVNRALADEVGREWVRTFAGQLTAETLLAALRSVQQAGTSGSPRLDARGWEEAGARHLAAYRRAVSLVRRRGQD